MNKLILYIVIPLGVVHKGRPHEGGGSDRCGHGGVRGNADVRKNNSYLLITSINYIDSHANCKFDLFISFEERWHKIHNK